MSSQADNKRWWALVVIALAQFITIMDTSIIGVALPDIQQALGFSQDGLSWVFNAYVIALRRPAAARRQALRPVRRARRLQRRLEPADRRLAHGRARRLRSARSNRARGTGRRRGADRPSALTLLMTLFGSEPRELTKALALYGAAAPAGGTADVFLGGVLTDVLDWRWTLLINVPVALAVLAATPALLPAGARRRERLDVVGSVLVTASLALAVFGIVDAENAGWGSTQTLGVLAGGLALIGAFVASQLRAHQPLVPLRVFRTGNFSAANASLLLLGAAWVPMWFVLNLYLQQVLGYGPFEAGSALVPMTALIMLLMVGAAARVIGRFGLKAPIVAGMAILAAGMGLLASLARTAALSQTCCGPR